MSNVTQLYKRTEVIGRGKFGIVYKGIHRATKQVYAIKVLNLDTSEDEVKDVQQEIQFLSHLKHVPNVTHYYGSYLNGTKLWIIMDYGAGGSLRTLLRPGTIEEKYIGVIVRELLVALQYIHKQSVIHRDIKAANVLITNEGKVMLCDFGVAAQLSSTSLRRNTMAGTPYWMAPEVIMEGTSYDVKADIWSLGITIYEIATGNPPYCDKEAMRAMQLITKSKPPRLDGLQYTPLLKEIIALCLDENPTERLSADDLLKTKFIKYHKNSPTSLLKELISRYLLWREKKSSRESIIMNVEDEQEESEIEVKWDFDSLRSNEYIMENDINLSNINLNDSDENFNFDHSEYDDGDDQFMTGYHGRMTNSNTATINHSNANTNNITYNKNTITYNTNVGSTLKANGTLNRKEAPKSLLQLFEERSELDEEEEDEDSERQREDVPLPRISSNMALHNLSGTNTTTTPRVSTPIVEIEIPNMDDFAPSQKEEFVKPRSRANTLVHSQSTAVLETRKTLDPGLQRRPTLMTASTSHPTTSSLPISQPPSQQQQQPSLHQSGNTPPSQSNIPIVPPAIGRSTPSPKRDLSTLTSPSKLSVLTSSPSKSGLSMKAIQSPSNPSPLLQPLNATLGSALPFQGTPSQQGSSAPSSATGSKPNVKRNHQNLRLQMPTPTSLNLPKLLNSTSNVTSETTDGDDKVNQFGVNVSNVPMAMTPLTEKQNPHNALPTAASGTTSNVTNNTTSSSAMATNTTPVAAQSAQPNVKRKMTNTSNQPPTMPFLTQRAGSSVSSQSSGDILSNMNYETASTITTGQSTRVPHAPSMDLSVFVDGHDSKEKMEHEIIGMLNGLSGMLGQMEEKLVSLSE